MSGVKADNVYSGQASLMTYSIDKDVTYGPLGIFEDTLISKLSRFGWKLRQSPVQKEGVPHLHINLGLSKDPAALIPAIFTGATLYAIPSWETSDYKLTANLIESSGEEHYYELRDKITLVQWLPMLLAFPFAYPFTAEEELVERMYGNVAYKISQDISIN